MKKAINNKKNSLQLPINMFEPARDFANHEEEYRKAINDVLRIGNFINGEQINILETNLSNYIGAKYCITCGNGTDALKIALITLGIKRGDKIITSVFSWISAAEVISSLGAIPIFCDIDENFNMDLEKLKLILQEHEVKCIIPISLFGRMINMNELHNIVGNIPIVEDAAQSFGAFNGENKSCNSSLISCTSFFPTKPLGCFGDGGALFTNDDLLAQEIRAIKNHGANKKYKHYRIGMNSRLDTIQAAILNVKLKYLQDTIDNRKKIAETYNDAFLKLNLILPSMIEGHVWSQYCIITPSQEFRDYLLDGLRENQINVNIYYPTILSEQECFQSDETFTMAKEISNRIISLPCHAELSSEEQKYIISCVKNLYNKFYS